jgi:hypothetical protein
MINDRGREGKSSSCEIGYNPLIDALWSDRAGRLGR